MARLQLFLFGGVDCRSVGGEPIALPTRKVRALLAYLAGGAGQAHRREKLAGLLWGDRPEALARADLRKSLSRLRLALPEPARRAIVSDGGCLILQPDAVDVDVVRFEQLAAAGTPETLERAAALYRGPFLDGFAECGEGFDDWLVAEQRRLDEILRLALDRLLDHYVVTGAIDRAIQIALRLLALDPLQEGVHRTLIRLYMYQDRVGSALEQHDRCRDLLADELGVEPAAETVRLRAELLKLLPAGAHPAPETDDLPERPTVIAVAAEQRSQRRAELGGRPSIAVLSFADRDSAADALLGDGLGEDIATELGRFRELDVIAPATALAYRDVVTPPEAVGRELGTAYVVHGGLRPWGGRLRITVRLIETDGGRQRWAERYDFALAEVFDVQDDIVRHIVGAVVGEIERDRLDAMSRQRPEDWHAYDLWLRGWSVLKRADLPAIHEARRYFRQAAQLDPGFGRAYVGLALAHLNEWACFSWSHWVFPRQEVLDFARRAVELDDHDHRAHCILAVALLYTGDYDAARGGIERALALNPNDADVLSHGSWALAIVGEHQRAVETGRRALRLAPHHPEWYPTFVGIALFAARRHEEAIDTMAAAPEALCNTPAFIAAAYAHLGQASRGAAYRDTVHRHYQRYLARGIFPPGTSCVDWLRALEPFRLQADTEHYVEGLRKAGIE